MRKTALFAAIVLAAPAFAEGPVTTTVEGAFDDVKFDVETAITNAGLVIDSVNHVGAMLERTKEDVGGTETLFTAADIYTFCSAEVSRMAMEADPMNLQHCPYGIFVYETPDAPGQVTVGHRAYPGESMGVVTELLGGIIGEALEGY